VKRIVLGNCHHWWHESGPEGAKATSPRVCMLQHSKLQREDGIVVGKSPQGLDLVEVAYADPMFVERATEHWPDGSVRLVGGAS
jgi:hypothetical protein